MKGCGVWNHHRSSSHRSLLFLLFCHASFKQIKLVNINPSDIIEGKPSVVLGLIWTIILYFQVSFSLSLSLLITVIMGTNPPNLKFHSHNAYIIFLFLQASLWMQPVSSGHLHYSLGTLQVELFMIFLVFRDFSIFGVFVCMYFIYDFGFIIDYRLKKTQKYWSWASVPAVVAV